MEASRVDTVARVALVGRTAAAVPAPPVAGTEEGAVEAQAAVLTEVVAEAPVDPAHLGQVAAVPLAVAAAIAKEQ